MPALKLVTPSPFLIHCHNLKIKYRQIIRLFSPFFPLRLTAPRILGRSADWTVLCDQRSIVQPAGENYAKMQYGTQAVTSSEMVARTDCDLYRSWV